MKPWTWLERMWGSGECGGRKGGYVASIGRGGWTVRARTSVPSVKRGVATPRGRKMTTARGWNMQDRGLRQGRGELKQKSPDSFSAREGPSSSPGHACTIKVVWSVFDITAGYALHGGKKMKWKYVLLSGARDVLARDITGLARASCMAFLAQRPWRRLNLPGGRHEGTIGMMGRIVTNHR